MKKETKAKPVAKTPSGKGNKGAKGAKSTAQMLRQRRLAVGLLAGMLVLLMLSTLLALPGLQNNLFMPEDAAPAEIPESQSLLTFEDMRQRTAAEADALPEADATAAVHFLDVGQGDAVLLEAGGEYALVDAGPPEGSENLLGYLQSLGIQRLKYLVMSHPHADHIGGMQAVVEAFLVDEVLLPDFEKAPLPTTALLENLLNAMNERQLPSKTMRTGDSYSLGGGSLRVLLDSLTSEDNYNLLSPMLLFESGDLRYLSTGDGEKENEEAALLAMPGLQANLFKAAHHGSTTSNTLPFLQAVTPRLVVVTCGENNSYGHPHKETLENFAAVGADVLRSDENGFIKVMSDGKGGLKVATSRPTEQQTSLLPQAA